ncbi:MULTISPECIES: hypothetical protein [Nocardia]|uniref:hypothetical protein n=1 Tax=Nocardia TaxID=1817 RepID=UPI00245843E7|nr:MULTISPECIES: hypothetical protein [Nocardia]
MDLAKNFPYQRQESKAQVSVVLTPVRRHPGTIFGDIFAAFQVSPFSQVNAAEAHVLH